MDTTTRKTEALYILKVIERGSADREFIGEARRKFYDLMNAQGCERRDYLDSVDACLMLPLPAGLRWLIQPESGANYAGAYLVPEALPEGEDHYTSKLAAWFGVMRTTPLAILKAWWMAQP